MDRIIVLFLFCISLAQSSYSQSINTEKLDTYFQALEENDKFLGSVAVAKNGEIVYTNSVGFADVKEGIEADENTKYRIGSISKTFTAVMIL